MSGRQRHQPLVGSVALGRLLEPWTSTARRSAGRRLRAMMAAASYAGTIGVPAVFGRTHFDALCSLPAPAGAAHLLRQAGGRVRRVAMPESAIDVDTPTALERLREGAAGLRLGRSLSVVPAQGQARRELDGVRGLRFASPSRTYTKVSLDTFV